MCTATTVVLDRLNINHPPPSLHLRQGAGFSLTASAGGSWELLASILIGRGLAGPRDTPPEWAALAVCKGRVDAPCGQHPGVPGRDFVPPMSLYSQSPDRV